MYTNQVHLANSVEHRDNEPDFEDMLSRQLAGALAGKRKWSVFYVQTQLENNTGRERERVVRDPVQQMEPTTDRAATSLV